MLEHRDTPAPSPGSGATVATAWPLRPAIALVVGVFGVTLLTSSILRATQRSGMSSVGVSLAILATFCLAYAFELGLVWAGAKRLGVGFVDSIGLRTVPRIAMWLGAAVAVGVALRIVATGYSAFMLAAGWRLPGWDANPLKYFPADVLGTAVLVVVVAVAAPVVEETVFRGVFLPSLMARFGRGWGIGICAVVFSAMHLNAFSFAPVLLVGFALSLLLLRSRSLWTSITCHAVFNGVGIAVVLLLRGRGLV